MSTTTHRNLQSDRRTLSVAADEWNADVTPKASIRIYGIDGNRVKPKPFDRTYKVGERAAYDGYNLTYIGPIVGIGAKTVTIDANSTGQGLKRLSLVRFVRENRETVEVFDARNAEEFQCL